MLIQALIRDEEANKVFASFFFIFKEIELRTHKSWMDESSSLDAWIDNRTFSVVQAKAANRRLTVVFGI